MKLKKLSLLIKIKKDIQKTKKVMLNKANLLLEIYAGQFNRLEKNMKKMIALKNRPKILILESWSPEDEDDKTLEGDKEEIDDIPPMLALEVNEEKFVDIQPMASLESDEEEVKKELKT